MLNVSNKTHHGLNLGYQDNMTNNNKDKTGNVFVQSLNKEYLL